MRHVISAGLFALASIGIAAQSPPAPTQTPAANQGPAKPVVAVGCLESATIGNHTQFTLTTIDTASVPVGTSGTVTTKPVLKTITYTLTPAPGVDLKSHVGQRVEVTGTEPPAESSTSPAETSRTSEPPVATSGTTGSVQMRPPTDAVARPLNVVSVKTVSSDCRMPD